MAGTPDDETYRYKVALAETASELVCRLTLDLPIDPVFAEDGCVYERKAIEEYIARASPRANGTLGVVSPMTGVAMGARLVPATQYSTMIKGMLQSGALAGQRATRYLERQRQFDAVQRAHCEADSGSAEAMHLLGRWHRHGEMGLTKDPYAGFCWFKRAAAAGHIQAMASIGIHHLKGSFVPQNIARAMHYLIRAADLGSDQACFWLGYAFATGKFNAPEDHELCALSGHQTLLQGYMLPGACMHQYACLDDAPSLGIRRANEALCCQCAARPATTTSCPPIVVHRARFWLSKMPSCTIVHALEENRERAATWLRNHPGGADEEGHGLEYDSTSDAVSRPSTARSRGTDAATDGGASTCSRVPPRHCS